MGMNVGGGSGGIKSEINVTPLVDVVLVLLIIFMVVMPEMRKSKDVLPPLAQNATEEELGKPLILSVRRDKKMYVEDEHCANAPALQARLREALREQPSRRILLNADRRLDFGAVREVMERARAAGAKGVAVAVVQSSD
jgi:biopolymer transport protein TolR